MSNDRKIAFASKLSFGVGQMAEGLKNTAFAAFALFFYTQVLEVPGWMVGGALGIALIFDAVTDPLAGSLSDNWNSKLGRRHPFMYASAVPLGICFYFLFAPPSFVIEAGSWALSGWLLTFAVLTRAAMTLYHVPHLALGAELTENFVERTSIVAYRQVFGVLGGAAAGVLGFSYFLRGEARTDAGSYPGFALFLSTLMIATILWSAWGTRREIPYLPAPNGERSDDNLLFRMGRELGGAFTNASFRWLFSGVLIVFMMVGIDGALNTHMGVFFWDLDSDQLGTLVVIVPVGLFVGAFFTRHLHARFDKKAGLVYGTAGWAVFETLPVALRLVGWFPENGSAALFPTLIAMRFAQGMIVQQALISFGSMMADVADEYELSSGRRQEGIFFGAVAFSGKASSGLGTILGGLVITMISWPLGADIVSSADVPAETIRNLGLIFGPGVCGFAVVSVWCYARYKLDRVRHEEILKELTLRRTAWKTDPRATDAA